jgi:hypothetical protein
MNRGFAVALRILSVLAAGISACGDSQPTKEAKQAYQSANAKIKEMESLPAGNYGAESLSGTFALYLSDEKGECRRGQSALPTGAAERVTYAALVHQDGALDLDFGGRVFRGALTKERSFKALRAHGSRLLEGDESHVRVGQELERRETVEGKFLDSDRFEGTLSTLAYAAAGGKLADLCRSQATFYAERSGWEVGIAAGGYRAALAAAPETVIFRGPAPLAVGGFFAAGIPLIGPGRSLLYPLAGGCFLRFPFADGYIHPDLNCRRR